jgi:c(7)-type cytochrome triheme protein
MNKTRWVALLGIAVFLTTPTGTVVADDKQPAAAAPVAQTPKVPEKIIFKKTGTMPPVSFPHALHGKWNTCKDCHGGAKPVFPQKYSETGLKMADIYAGQACGACHDGKKVVNGKTVFAAKTSCMKCHKKQ